MTPTQRAARDRIRAFTEIWPGNDSDLIMNIGRDDKDFRATLLHSDLITLLDMTTPPEPTLHPNGGIPG